MLVRLDDSVNKFRTLLTDQSFLFSIINILLVLLWFVIFSNIIVNYLRHHENEGGGEKINHIDLN